MGYRAQRFRFSIGRGWTLLLLGVGLLVAASFWIGPLRPQPAELELLAVAGDVAVPAIAVQGTVTGDGRVRFGVPLAVRNVGARAVQPRTLLLSVPSRFSLALPRGRLSGQVTPGVPLRRYEIDLAAPIIEPGLATSRLPTLDTVWLEPDLPSYYCTLSDAHVPEFEPAPPYSPGALADVRIFYSFVTSRPHERQTGLLTVQIDSSQLQTQPAPRPPTFPVVYDESARGLPELGKLFPAGTRHAWCGDPEQPVELYTTVWENLAGARVLVVHVNGQPRKHLYDANEDGIVELETWDADGDEHFEARRPARFAIPRFLLPLPPRNPEMLRPDSTPPDSAWLAVFSDRSRGPWRFARRAERLRADSLALARAYADSVARLAADTVITRRPLAATPGLATSADSAAIAGVAPPSPEFLSMFGNVAAGPFRFSPRTAAATPRTGQEAGTDGGPDAAARAAAAQAAVTTDTTTRADTAVAEPDPQPRRRRPLGTPVGVGRDTTTTVRSDTSPARLSSHTQQTFSRRQ